MEPIARRTRLSLENQKKTFSDLPYDVVRIIVGMLDTSSRSKFSRVSRGCQKVVEDLGKRVTSMVVTRNTLATLNRSAIVIMVRAIDLESKLVFTGRTVNVEIRSRVESRVKKLKIEETGNLSSIIARYFGYIVNSCNRNAMGLLNIYVPEFPYRQTSIARLKNIEILNLEQNKSSKNCLISCGFLKMKQVQNIRRQLHVSGVIDKLVQLKTLVSPLLMLESRFYTNRFVNEYLKLFVNHELSRAVRLVILKRPKHHFCFGQVVDGLEMVARIKCLMRNRRSERGVLVSIAPNNINDSIVCQVTVQFCTTSIQLGFFDVQQYVKRRMPYFEGVKKKIFEKTGQTITVPENL